MPLIMGSVTMFVPGWGSDNGDYLYRRGPDGVGGVFPRRGFLLGPGSLAEEKTNGGKEKSGRRKGSPLSPKKVLSPLRARLGDSYP